MVWPCLDGRIVEYQRQNSRRDLSVDEIRKRLSEPAGRKRRESKPKQVCRRGHPLKGANLLYEANGTVRRCLMCRSENLHERLRRQHKPHPSETGVCKKGLHAWVEGARRCSECTRARHALDYPTKQNIHCVVKGCERLTHRADGNYICKQHRANPPEWIARTGLKIVGTRLIPA